MGEAAIFLLSEKVVLVPSVGGYELAFAGEDVEGGGCVEGLNFEPSGMGFGLDLPGFAVVGALGDAVVVAVVGDRLEAKGNRGAGA